MKAKHVSHIMRYSRLVLLAGLSHFPSWADEYHYNNLLVGGEAVAMGGAYTALANDLSVMHYNVAGLSFVKDAKTASINTLAWEQTDFKQVFSNGDDFKRDAFSVIPGFFGISVSHDKWTYGVSVAADDFSKERSSQDSTYQIMLDGFTQAQNVNEYVHINIDNAAYHFTIAGAFQVNQQLSYGMGLSVVYREFQTVQGSGAQTTQKLNGQSYTSGFDASRRFEDRLWLLQPRIALQYHYHDWLVGVQLSQDLTLSREYEETANIIVSSPLPFPDSVTPVSRITAKHDDEQDYPVHIATGIAHQFNQLLVSVDWHYFSEVNNKEHVVNSFQTPITRDLRAVNNFALGLKYPVSHQSSIAFGWFTDNSNGKIETDIDFQRVEDIDLMGVSLAFESVFAGMPFTIGGYYKWGDGQVRVADIRSVEAIVGLPLYPENNDFDIADGTKKSFVLYISLDF